MEDLTLEELELILTSLDYTKQKFQSYSYYPSYEFKQQRIAEVKIIIEKVRAIKKAMKSKAGK
jgi:hypothetical protein